MGAVNLSLTVFFPCYNEESNVERTTLAALEACSSLCRDFEIIIVNDGSTDGTGVIAESLAKQYPQVRAVHNQMNLGYGGAVKRGIQSARKEWIFFSDGDGQFDFKEIELLLPLLKTHDIAVGYRINRQESIIRRLNGWSWTVLMNRIFKLNVRDVDCAFKLFPRQLFERIELKANGAMISTEILARARKLGLSVGQIGVHHFPRRAGEPTGASIKVIFRAFHELWRLRREIQSTQSNLPRAAS